MKRKRTIQTEVHLKAKSFGTTRCVYDEATRIAEAMNETIKNLLWVLLLHC
jgi:hypothetical protein